MLIRTGKQKFFAALFVCGVAVWGAVGAFVELRESGGGADRWRIDHVTDAGVLSDEESFQIIDIDGGTDPRFNLYLDNGRLGVSQYCALDGTSCSTAAQIATAVTGYTAGDGLGLAGNDFGVNVDDSSIEISGDALQLKDLGVTTGKINDDAVTLDKLAVNSVNSAKIVNDTILFEDLTGGLVLTAAEDDATTTGDLDGGSDAIIPTTDAVIGYVSSYVTANGDDLGDHIAIQDLDLTTNDLIGTTAGINFDNFDVDSSGNTTIGGTLNVSGVTQLGLDGADGSLVIYSDDVGGDFTYTIQPGVATQNVVLTLPVDDGTTGQILQTDGNGVLSWVGQAGADDLGDHTASQDLDLATNDLIGTTAGINFDSFDVDSSGNTTVGGTFQVGSGATINTIETSLTNTSDTAVPTSKAVADYFTGGAGLTVTDGDFAVNVDDVTLEIATDILQIKDGGVDADAIGTDAVGADELADDAVDTDAILDLNVTKAKLAASSVDSSKIEDGTIAFDDLAGALILTDAEDAGDNLGGGADNVIATTDAVKAYVDDQFGLISENTLDAAYDQGGNGSGRTINVTDGAVQLLGVSDSDEVLEISLETTTANAIADVAVISASTSDVGNGASGLGAGLVFEVENDAGEIEERARIDTGLTDVADGLEDGQFVFQVQEDGVIGTEFTISGEGISLASGAAVNNIETALTNNDTRLPTSGAVVDYVTTYVAANGDDLGDHTATQDLDLATNDLIGTTAGINLANFDVDGSNGNTIVGGTLTSTGDFDVNSDKFTVNATTGNTAVGGTLGVTGALTAASIQLGGSGATPTTFSTATDLGAGAASDTAIPTQLAIKTYVDAQVGDNLGDHTATTDLNMAGNWIGGDGDGAEGVFVDTDGDVGIGTDTPSADLEVNGQILASGTITSSDLRLKENIQPLKNSLDKIRQVNTYSYTWKDQQRGKGLQFGVIAQEMEQIYPDVVHTFEDGYKAVNYQALVAPLIEAVKELSDRVETLEAENAALQNAVQNP